MLTLTRKPNERIILELPDGRKIVVEPRDIRRNQVAIGIDAPQDVIIYREELSDENQSDK